MVIRSKNQADKLIRELHRENPDEFWEFLGEIWEEICENLDLSLNNP